MDNYTGKRLDGRYEIQEVIGVGGMAVVYKAYDNIDDRIVSVKILKDEFLANEEFRRRFKNESKAISLLSHPNIVKVYNVNYGDRLQYIVMEYVEGITLKEYIEQQGRLGIKETIHFTTQILRALQHAHDKGIIHRDIKPQNILLLSNGNIKVTDFGIARFSYSDTKTMTDSAIGSVHYISPEQARGNSIDERTDIYSVGVVMYEMLTGKLPFVSDNSVSVALMQLQSDAKSIREINPNIPVGLEQIVKRAMEKDTKQRYQTASEMLLDIEEFKRNPNIRFRQDYFVDSDPTKFATKTPSQTPVSTPNPPVKANTQAVIDDEDDEDERKGGKAGFIIVGVLLGLLVVGLVVFAGLYFFTDVFAKEAAVVPNFVGMDYETEIKDNREYSSLNFDVVYEANSLLNNGMVYDQDPPANRKMDAASNTIILYVVNNSEPIAIPDVSGKMWEAAQTMLENKGFKVSLLPTVSATIEYGTVIKTSPAAGTEAEPGSTVILYYASDEDLIEVPNVVGWDYNMAKEKLESMKLAIDTSYEERASDKPKGEILAQNPEEGDKVMEGTRIAVVVSSGVPEVMTATIKIDLPNSGTRQSFDVYVNNESVASKSLMMDGSEYSFTVSGSDAAASVKVYINNSEYYHCTVDFTKNPASVSNDGYAYRSSSSAVLPDVTGMNMEAAKSALAARGFKNVKIKYSETIDKSRDGVVISQSPEGSSTSSIVGIITGSIPTDTEVTLTVGQYIGI